LRIQVDVKPHNDPERLFTLMHEIISAQEDWQTALARRVILGLWHPRFNLATIKIVPYLRRSYIRASIFLARDYFWDYCHTFSVNFATLATTEGARVGWVTVLCSNPDEFLTGGRPGRWKGYSGLDG
jgi:phosphatidylglycerol phospholipase C